MSVVKIKSALEVALDAMSGMMAITSSSVAAQTVITTAFPHGLSTNDEIAIVGHSGSTPSISGRYLITSISANTFSIPVTVTVAGTGGGFTATSFENRAFKTPAPSTPYQRVWFMDFMTDNPSFGDGFHRIETYLQIDLYYPTGYGTKSIDTRAELIKSTFKRGASFSYSGVTVIIGKTPEIGAGMVEGDRYKKIVKITYWADIF